MIYDGRRRRKKERLRRNSRLARQQESISPLQKINFKTIDSHLRGRERYPLSALNSRRGDKRRKSLPERESWLSRSENARRQEIFRFFPSVGDDFSRRRAAAASFSAINFSRIIAEPDQRSAFSDTLHFFFSFFLFSRDSLHYALLFLTIQPRMQRPLVSRAQSIFEIDGRVPGRNRWKIITVNETNGPAASPRLVFTTDFTLVKFSSP